MTSVVLVIATSLLRESFETLLLLCGLALAMTAVALRLPPTGAEYRFGLMAEGIIACGIVLFGTSSSDIYIVYLAAPTFLAGLRGGLLPGLSVVGGEFVVAAAFQATTTQPDRPHFVALLGSWLFMAFSVCVLGAWIKQLQLLQRDTRLSPYASAHRLLGQLRAVTRELSGGLDIEVVSESVLSAASAALRGGRTALLLLGDSGDLTVVAHRGDAGFTSSLDRDPLVQRVLASHHAQQQHEPHGQAQHRFRACLPVMVGLRVIGVVVVD
ncbi:MAG: hypothetical protein H0U53_00545, partial [Actinobacteria bacterium]|nr:hypothetical protein [Actinomycetota bacterium]